MLHFKHAVVFCECLEAGFSVLGESDISEGIFTYSILSHGYVSTLQNFSFLFAELKKFWFLVTMQIVIVTNEEEKEQFVREVGEDVLPEEYGGRAKFVAIQDVVLPPLED